MSKVDSGETVKTLFGLVELLKQIEEDQKHMTEEEKKCNEWAAWDGDKMLLSISASFNQIKP